MGAHRQDRRKTTLPHTAGVNFRIGDCTGRNAVRLQIEYAPDSSC